MEPLSPSRFKNRIGPIVHVNSFLKALKESTMDINSPKQAFTIKYDQLSYTATSGIIKKKKKLIFNSLKGSMKSSTLVGIMGPSGSGKSTLLECLANHRVQGRTGDIVLESDLITSVKMAFIPQHDSYYEVLTVRECIMFASKLQNATKKKHGESYLQSVVSQESLSGDKLEGKMDHSLMSETNVHAVIASDVMTMLGLDSIADVTTGRISGGQKKRLSIAQELMSNPNILLLDEPTSGLDSSATWSLIQVLNTLINQNHPMVIISTIHQPSVKVYESFHQVIMLSSIGVCAYDGPPSETTSFLKSLSITLPAYFNPADILIEAAAGDHGVEVVQSMVRLKEEIEFVKEMERAPTAANIRRISWLEAKGIRKYHPPIKTDSRVATKPPKFPKIKHFKILLHRSFLLIIRDPKVMSCRIIMHLAIALFVGFLYGKRIGSVSGCPPDISHVRDFNVEFFDSMKREITNNLRNVMDNLSNLFFNVMIVFFAALLPVVLSFPSEVSIFVKEKHNSWYGTGTYYLAKSLADVPFTILFPVIYSCITYYMNDQPMDEEWRFFSYQGVMIISAFIGQSMGLIVASIFMHDPSAAVFVAPISVLPLFLFSGILVKVDAMPYIFRFFSYFSSVRFTMEAILIIIYGFGRCTVNPMEIAIARHMFISWFHSITSPADDDYDSFDGNHGNGTGNELPFDSKALAKSIADTLLQGIGGSKSGDGGSEPMESGVMAIFNLKNDHLYYCLMMLWVNFAVIRIATFGVIKYKANSGK